MLLFFLGIIELLLPVQRIGRDFQVGVLFSDETTKMGKIFTPHFVNLLYKLLITPLKYQHGNPKNEASDDDFCCFSNQAIFRFHVDFPEGACGEP